MPTYPDSSMSGRFSSAVVMRVVVCGKIKMKILAPKIEYDFCPRVEDQNAAI